MTIEPYTGDAGVVQERAFHFCCFGNFSGLNTERAELVPRAVNANAWDSLFQVLEPRVSVLISLQGVDDFQQEIRFNGSRDFKRKGLAEIIPLLKTIKELKAKVGQASEESPIDVAGLAGEDIERLKRMASAGKDFSQVVDLLSMVDIGEEDDSEGLDLQHLKHFFSEPVFKGKDRHKVEGNLAAIEKSVFEQIESDPAFCGLEAQWRALRVVSQATKEVCRLSMVDCMKEELCDALFLCFIKPESGEAPPRLDLAFAGFEFDHLEPDHEPLHHLGRMSESLAAPLILNADPKIFNLKNFTALSHLRDFSGVLGGPAYIKWRKLRDEPGAEWLFMGLNPFLIAQDDSGRQIWGPPAHLIASVIADQLEDGKWPAELLGPMGKTDRAENCKAKLSDDQANDLSFEGFCVLGGQGGAVRLQGMNAFAHVKLTGPEALSAANLVAYTLAYRFFVGACSRYLTEVYAQNRDNAAFAAYLGLKTESDLRFEEEDEQLFCRIKAPFTVLGVQPEVVLGLG